VFCFEIKEICKYFKNPIDWVIDWKSLKEKMSKGFINWQFIEKKSKWPKT
jgi:hypothetical protein